MDDPDLLAFDRICVLNPAGRTAPRRQAQAQFDRLRLPVDCERVRLVAIGEGLTSPPDERQMRQLATHCALAALRQARTDGLRHVLVVQDDAVFAQPGTGPGISTLPADDTHAAWDLALLGHGGEPHATAEPGRRMRERVPSPDCVAVAASAFEAVIADLEATLSSSAYAHGQPMATVFADIQQVLGAAPERHASMHVWVSTRSITVRPAQGRPGPYGVDARPLLRRWRKAAGSP